MVRFTIRVQLDGSPPEDEYQRLHAEMLSRGARRFVKDGRSGQWFKLPHAEYSRVADLTNQQVLDEAKEAALAAAPTRSYKILVTRSAGRVWSGLEKATVEEVRRG